MKIHKIVQPTPYAVGDVNSFLVKGDTLSIFDVGPKTKETFEALQAGIKEAGYSFEDIEQVVLTHHHPDHSGWIDAFPHAEIIGHPYVDYYLKRDKDYLAYRKEFMNTHLTLGGVPQDKKDRIVNAPVESKLFGTLPLTKYLHDGDEVPGHPGLITYYTPGHAQSHFIFVHEQTQTAISGDLLLEKITPNPLVETPVDLSMNRPKYFVQYLESLKVLKKFNLIKIFPGHGNEFGNIDDHINLQFEKAHERALQVLQLLDEPKTLMDVTKQFYAAIYEKQLGLTLSKTLGYLDYLVNKEYITMERNGDVYLYKKL